MEEHPSLCEKKFIRRQNYLKGKWKGKQPFHIGSRSDCFTGRQLSFHPFLHCYQISFSKCWYHFKCAIKKRGLVFYSNVQRVLNRSMSLVLFTMTFIRITLPLIDLMAMCNPIIIDFGKACRLGTGRCSKVKTWIGTLISIHGLLQKPLWGTQRIQSKWCLWFGVLDEDCE